MGGSGGRYFPSFTPQEFKDKVRQAEEAARDEAYEAEANALLADCLAQFNDRDTARIKEILDRVKNELTDEFEETVELLFGGSVAKRTYVDGLSDVDALLLLNPANASEQTPEEVKQTCAKRLREIFGKDAVSAGRLAVTVETDGQVLQFLPALRSGEHFKISNPEGTDWARIRPRAFAQSLSEANANLGYKLVPTIKLAKAIIGQLPEQRRLSGYHVEALALKIFENYTGEQLPRAMLKYFFENASGKLQRPMEDVTGQSAHLDEYLGPANSLQRKIMADACDRIGRRLKNADGAKDITLWKQVFGNGPSP
jgi:hypothetical protein